MEFNRKKILFLIFLVLALIGIAYFFNKKKVETPLPLPISSLPSQKLPKPVNPVARIMNPVIYTEEKCKNIDDEYEKNLCFDKIQSGNAALSKNVKECLKIFDHDVRNRCIYDKVRITGNIDECKRIFDDKLKEICIQGVGIDLRDINYCNEFLKEPHEYQECVDRINAFKIGERTGDKIKNINDCIKIKSLEYSNLCLLRVAMNQGTVNCSDIEDKYFENRCISKNLFNSGNIKNKEECDNLPDEQYKGVCLSSFGGVIDSDQDGLNDAKELWVNTDPFDSDTDKDGLNDYEEVIINYTNPIQADSDYDSLTDYDEIKKYKTDPNKPDTDGDGILDGEEVKKDTNPHTGDADADELSDIDEAKFGTDKNNPDTDGDGMSDLEETRNGFDSLRSGQDLSDTDGDGLLDIDEIFYGADRFNKDTDGDGMSDKQEVDNLTNPLGSGDMDFDRDGISDKDEEKYKTNPSLKDSDGDGLSDYDEIFVYKTDPSKKDTDKDGYSDGDEVKNGYNPLVKGE